MKKNVNKYLTNYKNKNLITGASTEEAQQRVALEVAEQFLALSEKSKKYSVTGVVNPQVLTA